MNQEIAKISGSAQTTSVPVRATTITVAGPPPEVAATAATEAKLSWLARGYKRLSDPVASALQGFATMTERVGNTVALVLPTGAHDERFRPLQVHGRVGFTRIINDKTPGLAQQVVDHVRYGSAVVYVDPAKPSPVKHVQGVVWHETPKDIAAVSGTLGLNTNLELQAPFEDKLYEARFVETHAPGSMPRTQSMGDFAREHGLSVPKDPAGREAYLDALEAALRKRYGSGYILKGNFDANTGGNLPTDKHSLKDVWQRYEQQYLPDMARLEQQHPGVNFRDPEHPLVVQYLRGHPAGEGRTVELLLKDPGKVIVQEKLKLARWTDKALPKDQQPFHEFRTHVVNGQLVPGTSSHRWSIKENLDNPQILRGAEEFAQQVFDKLPRDVVGNLSFAPDVALLDDGSYRLIELNVLGMSGFLQKNPLAARALSEAIRGKELLGNQVLRPVALVVKKSTKYAGNVFRWAAGAIRLR